MTQEQKERLASPLPQDAVKTRTQSNLTLSYVESHYIIRTANDIFGFDGWSSETPAYSMVQREIKKSDKGEQFYIGYVCTVKVSALGTTKDGVGFGQGIDRDEGRAHESAIKEAESDAEKRALRKFGDQFGLALYDKEQKHVDKTPIPAKPRTGEANTSSPFGFKPEITIHESSLGQDVSDPQKKKLINECMNLGVGKEHSGAFCSFICREYGITKPITKGGYIFAIDWLMNAPEESKVQALDAFADALQRLAEEKKTA